MERLTIKAPSGLIHLKDNEEATINIAIKRLSDYEDLEEQGKLLKLPCAVGDTVYCVDPFCDGNDLLCMHRHYYCGRCALREKNVHERKLSLSMVKNFGKSVFLFREETEAALKEERKRKGLSQ